MRVLEFSGTPNVIGAAFGETCRGQIREFYEHRVANALGQARAYGGRDVGEDTLLRLAEASIAPTRAYDPQGALELEGIAAGAGLALAQVLAMNGLTDFRDVLAWQGDLETFGGCSAFVAQPDVTAAGHAICGQTWDLATDNMPYVVGVVRRPDGAPATWTLTTVGCLSLIGINDEGIAIGTTNVRTTDSRRGVTYLSLIHKALSQRTFEAAVECIVSAERAGGHFYYVVDAHGRAAALECTALHVHRHDIERGHYVHTNHCLIPQHAALEGNTPQQSSHTRMRRLDALLAEAAGRIDLAAAQRFLADRAHGADAICRDDYGGISTNGAIVMEPAAGRVRACHGLPDAAEWIDLRMR